MELDATVERVGGRFDFTGGSVDLGGGGLSFDSAGEGGGRVRAGSGGNAGGGSLVSGGGEHAALASAENTPSGSRSTTPRRRGSILKNGDENAAKERALSFDRDALHKSPGGPARRRSRSGSKDRTTGSADGGGGAKAIGKGQKGGART